MDMYTWDFALYGYGNRWRKCRRLFHEFLNMKVVSRFDDCIDKHIRRFLFRLAETPDGFLGHTQLWVPLCWAVLPKLTLISSVTGALIMEIAYGLDIKSHEDKFLQAAEVATGHFEDAIVPGAFLIDTFPIRSSPEVLNPCGTRLTIRPPVKYVPGWFPGAGFKQFAKIGQVLFDIAVDGPFDYVKETLKVGLSALRTDGSTPGLNDVKAGGGNDSVAASCFDRVAELADQGFDEGDIRAMTATMYMGEMNCRSYVWTCSSILRRRGSCGGCRE